MATPTTQSVPPPERAPELAASEPELPPDAVPTTLRFDVALAMSIVAGIGVANWATGDTISLAFLDLFPILFVAYRRRAPVAVGVLCAALAVGVAVDVLTGAYGRLGAFVAAFRTIERGVAYGLTVALVSLLRRERDQARARALLDPLTELPNRRMLEAALLREARRAERAGEAVAIAAIDLDGFKEVNDSLGHNAGDRILVAIAQVLRATRGGDFACRLGGDEFLLVLADVGADEARRGLDRVLEDLRAAMSTARARITFSVGFAVFEGRMPSPATMLARADAAMYLVKRGTRDGVREARFFDGASRPPA